MTAFKMPEPEFKDLGYAYTTCVSGALFSEKQIKQAMRDMLEQAERELLKTAAHLGIVNHFATKQFAEAIRAMKEQIK